MRRTLAADPRVGIVQPCVHLCLNAIQKDKEMPVPRRPTMLTLRALRKSHAKTFRRSPNYR